MQKINIANVIIFSALATLFSFVIILLGFLLKIIDQVLIYFSILFLINSFFFLTLFLRKRNYHAKTSWFLVMALLPILGFTLYIFFGQKYSYRISEKLYHKKKNKYAFIPDNFYKSSKNKKLFEELKKMSKNELMQSKVIFESNTEKIFDDVLYELRNAKRYIFLNFYIAKEGEVFQEIKTILLEKASKGLEIKVIFDDFGIWKIPKSIIKEFRQNNIQITIFGEIFFPFIGSNNGFRTHRKMIIIDGKTSFIGGINISDECISYSKKFGYWLDLNVKLKGEFVNTIVSLFLFDWELYTNKKLDKNKYFNYEYKNKKNKNHNPILLIEDGPLVEKNTIEDCLIALISNANKSIKLATPYFVPTEGIRKILINKIRLGVDVEIYIPGRKDKKITYNASFFETINLEQIGAKIFFTNNIFLHTKMGIFDNKYTYTGTANLDMRSMNSQFEVIIIMDTNKELLFINNLFNYYKFISVPRNKIKKNVKSSTNRFISKLLGPLL